MFKIVSFYTGHYEWDAKQLVKSMNKANFRNYEVDYKDRIGSWETNTQMKAPFLLEKLKENDAIVWTDADSRVLKYPELFNDIETDVGLFFLPYDKVGKLPSNSILTDDIVKEQGYLQSGTMFFKNNFRTISLLEQWIKLNESDRNQWDQWTLQYALNSVPDLTITILPPEYVWIDNISPTQYGDLQPVIYHTQASRKFKKSINSSVIIEKE